ncbi:MAG: hypothetical protein KGL39_49670, partial [Patescibacteria group bacterium]|nr:hypothetical protein [Patescibacteria group bacterium]
QKHLFYDSSLVAYYRLEDTTAQAGGVNLTNNNSVAFDAAKFGNGADGGTSNTNKNLVETTGSFGITNGAQTLNCWYKMNVLPSGSPQWTLADLSYTGTNDSSNNLFFIFNNGGTIELSAYYHNFNSAVHLPLTTSFDTSTFHMITGVYTGDGLSGSLFSGYYDGAFKASSTISGAGTANWSTGFSVLSGSTNSGNNFNQLYSPAVVDDCSIFNRALSASEISQLYTSRSLDSGISR